MLIGIDANEASIKNRVGINMYAFYLLHALKNLKTKHKFIIYLKHPPLPDMPTNTSSFEYRVIPFPRLWTQTRLPFDLYFHRPRPDVFLSLTHYAPRFSPLPVVISIMDLGFLTYPDQFTSKDLNQLTSWTAYSIRKATKIIAISEYTKSELVKYYHRPPGDITVTHLGYDKNVFYPHSDPKILQKYGLKKPYILFVSSLKPSKNVEGLLKAFDIFLNTPLSSPPKIGGERGEVGEKHQLIISGKKAWMYEKIFKLVQELNLENKVIFTDFLPASDVPILMSDAACFVLPSFHEGFAIPAVEAMACGTPVVVSQVANLPEIAGNAVIYIDPYDIKSIAAGIQTALGSKRDEFVKKGLERVKLFSWAKCARQTLLCLQNAISSPK